MAVLQVSSSLDWKTVTVGGKAVQFLTQDYTTDIDHTGALSEAIVSLPAPVPPQGTVKLEVRYAGDIVQDASRLTRRPPSPDPGWTSPRRSVPVPR